MVPYTYDFSLVLAAIFISFMAAFTGLALTNGISQLSVNARKTLVVMSAFVLGGGIWSMHFVAMLAMDFPITIFYDALYTLGSALIAILLVGVALLLMHFRVRTPRNMVIAGILLGSGIISMHFLGISGMRGCLPVFELPGKAVAVILAAAMGVAAIWAAYGKRTKQNIVAGTLVFGLSVVVVHFSAMYWTGFLPMPAPETMTTSLENGTLAIIVTLAAFVICGTFLLSAVTFIAPGGALAEATPQTARPGAAKPEQTAPAPNGALQPETKAKAGPAPIPYDTPVLGIPPVVRIPYERDKKTFFISSDVIAAVRAEGRYTYLYAENEKLFCPWSISEAEKRLPATQFHRTHRSYLVNIGHVTSFERRKDKAACRFDAFSHLPAVPVSRTRIEPLREALGL
ncbi:carbon monoxide dehydrogenase [Pelagibius litoralis]|uniref:Carbon monoxide dehydrogenase n=1 Tax=Pelagibius litoralis TaxID=374515 RepID=A0A967C1Z1_9PROT|nr:MHYT domain-containing protein [Pelagibius litoralis]NIA68326.1 carbon monoxide dehydrogenase [Pelagibius litoralis]